MRISLCISVPVIEGKGAHDERMKKVGNETLFTAL